jgi:hypothetical protein
MYVLEVEAELRRLGWASGRSAGFSIVDMLVALSAWKTSVLRQQGSDS